MNRGRWLIYVAVFASLTVAALTTAQVVPTVQTTFQSLTAGRVLGAGDAPTCSSTGLGTGSAAIAAGSTDFASACTLSPTGAPAALGVVTLTFSTGAGAYGAANGPFCSCLLVNTTGTWSPRASCIVAALSTTAPTLNWDNNAVALTAGQAYRVYVTCIGRQ